MKYKRISALVVAAFAVVLSPVLNAYAQTPANAPERLIITFNGKVSDKAKAAVTNTGASELKDLPLVNGLAVVVPNDAAAKRLTRIEGVKRVETDARVFATGGPSCSPWPSCRNQTTTTTPTQPAQQLPWGVARIDAAKAWPTSQGAGVKVAIIDTGIDKTHPDLVDNVAGGVNFVRSNGPSWRAPDATAWGDNNGHGTHVAGTIAAADNTIGVVGVAPKASLYGVKALDASGSGYISDIISGIQWSIDNHMNVINMSLGSDTSVQALQDAVDAAYQAGIVVVAAAGNSGDGNAATDNVEYPGRYSSVIAVAAVDNNDQVAYFSSDGPEVEVAAPGVNILSTTMDGSYGTMSGTSMASPHVAGVVADILGSPIPASADTDGNGQWSASEVRAVLDKTADDLGTAGKDVFYGNGLVDTEEAVTGLQTQ